MDSMAKDRRACATGPGIEGRRLLVLERDSLGQPIDPHGQERIRTQSQVIKHRVSNYNVGCVGFRYARCWSDRRKCGVQGEK